jgi:menaquinol-cytochrome c reductase cytochrome b/c subunit
VNDEQKKRYIERYKEKKRNGEFFWPDSIAKDAVVSLMVFTLLIALATFAGVPSEPPANPADSTYIPRPEWYFLWTFQLLKYFPGKLEGVAIVGLGLLIVLGLFGLPFFDRGPKRHPFNRPFASAIMVLIVAGLVFLTIQAVVTTPPQAEAVNLGADLASRVKAGGELYQKNCADCHGADGEGAEIKNRAGEFTFPLNSDDFLMTRTSDTIAQVISFGQPGQGMQAFGLAYGGQLTEQEIRAIVAFVQSWYVPPEAEAAQGKDAAQDLAKIENPGFAKDIVPLLSKSCSSCHSKRVKGNFSVESYEQVMTSGDHAPAVIAGDAADSNLAKMLRGIKTPAGGQMPPTRPLKQPQIDLIERWINQGAQNN